MKKEQAFYLKSRVLIVDMMFNRLEDGIKHETAIRMSPKKT